jgi:hypothetical protein
VGLDLRDGELQVASSKEWGEIFVTANCKSSLNASVFAPGAVEVVVSPRSSFWFCKSSPNDSVFAPDAVEVGVSPLS